MIRKPHHKTTTTTTPTIPNHRSTSSCAACKFLKRRCVTTCIFAPYFRSDEPRKFAKVHKVFGASNVSKLLYDVPEEQREDTVNSLAFEAEARLRDPVYGCIGAIALLQRKMFELQHDLALAKARLARYNYSTTTTTSATMTTELSEYVMMSGSGESGMVVGGGCDGNCGCCCSGSYNIPVGVNNEGVVVVGGVGTITGTATATTALLEDGCWGFNSEDVAAGVFYNTSNCGGGGGGGNTVTLGGEVNGTLVSGLHNSDHHQQLQEIAAVGAGGGEFGQTSFPL